MGVCDVLPFPVPLAFCITDLDPGGAERALVRVVTGLDQSVWAPRVYCLSNRGELASILEQRGIPVECLGASRRWEIRVILRLAKSLKQQRPALLQTFLYHANLAGRLAGRWAGVPRIVSGIRVAERRSQWRLWIDRWTERLVDAHVCVSDSVADFSVRAGLPRRKISVIPNGVDADVFANAAPADLSCLGIPANADVVISVARLDPQKGLDTLIRAFDAVALEYPQLHLLLVGEGPSRNELTHLATTTIVRARIHFAGRRDDVPALLKASKLFVLPSRWEGLPNAVLEAMASGIPVIASSVEGSRELIQSGEAGWLFSPESWKELAAQIRSVLQYPALAARMAISAQKLVITQFTWNRCVRDYDALYRRLLGLPPRDAAPEKK